MKNHFSNNLPYDSLAFTSQLILMEKAPIIYIVSDQQADVSRIKAQLLQYNPDCIFVTATDKSSFLKKLSWFRPEFIITSFRAPSFLGLDVLNRIKDYNWYVPLIFIAGDTIGTAPLLKEKITQYVDEYIIEEDIDKLQEYISTIMDRTGKKIDDHKKKYSHEVHQSLELFKIAELTRKTLDVNSNNAFA